MFYGYMGQLSFWQYVAIALVFTHITIISVTVYLHRHQAHRALDLHPIVSHFFRLWLWLTTGMETGAWASIHRKHHAKCETEDDPHSPQVMGLKTVLWQGAELYRREAKNKETFARYGQGTPNDWLEQNLYRKRSALGIKIMFLSNVLLFGMPGLTIWAVQMAWIPLFAAGVINGMGHYWGYRNVECPDASTNISPWGILIGGEELHNNHHAYPTSAKLSMQPWEFDAGWLYIKLLSFVGLAKPKRAIPQAVVELGKNGIDDETLSALIANRFQILTVYTKKVILPVWLKEKEHAKDKKLWNKMKEALIKADALVDTKTKAKLEISLKEHQLAHKLYVLRQNLQAIWDRTTASKNELLEAFHEWCHQAEASGVEALKEFAAYIKGYKLKYAF
ncbi:MAG: fatty acid desaturase [Gammaproteobacteria bacterium]